MPAARASSGHQRDAHRGIGMHVSARHGVEGEREQRVAGQDRGRLVEGLVHRRPPAPQIVVVHGRQVVVHQRITMDEFERAAGVQRAGAADAEQRRALHHQKRPQAFAAAERAMPHGGEQALRPGDLAGQRRAVEQPLEQALGLARDGGQPRTEVQWGVLGELASMRPFTSPPHSPQLGPAMR